MSCNTPPLKIDAETIDELVAGNLEGDRYRQVLRALEAEPEKWRDCALAFLEEQAITRDLKMISSCGQVFAEATEEGCQVSEDSQAILERSAESAGDSHSIPNYARLQWMHRLTSLAAMLLISFTVGWFGSGMLSQKRGTASADTIATPRNPTPAPSNLADAGGEDASLRLVADEMIPVRQSPPPDILRELQRTRRIELESTDMLVPVLEGDSVIFVPVQQHRVRSRSPF